MQRHLVPAALAWLAAALLALGAWLALPRERAVSGRPVHAILVDVSASALGSRSASARVLRDQIDALVRDARRPGTDVIGVAFGHGARAFDLTSGPETTAPGEGEDRTDFAAALELCATLARGRRLVGVDVIGDGTWTGADPAPIAARLVEGGTHIRIGRLWDPPGWRPYVAPLESPIRVRRGEPLRIEVETWRDVHALAYHAQRQRYAVLADLTGGSATTARRIEVDVDPRAHGPSASRVAFEFPALDRGTARLDVRLVFLDVDGGASDVSGPAATAQVLVVAEGQLTVGIRAEAALRTELADTLGAANPDLALVPLDASDAIEGVDVLVTLDQAFDRASAERIDAFVASGGGWVDFAGGSAATRVRPVAAALAPRLEDDRPREIVVLVDGSGSMSGAPAIAARTALARLVEVARTEEGMSVAWFGAEPLAYADLGRPGERASAAGRRAALEVVARSPEPHGPTRVLGALEEFARRGDSRGPTLAILVTDGRDADPGDAAARIARLRAELARRYVDLVVVSAGADPDRALLAALAGDAAHVLDAGELASRDGAERLAALLERALATGAVVETAKPRPAVQTDDGTSFAAPFVSIEPPLVRRAVDSYARHGASVVWIDAGNHGAPLLAFARRGLGASAGFAFVPDAGWLADSSAIGAAIATAIRAVAPPPDRARPRLVERDGELVLEGAEAGTPAIVPVDLFAAEDGRMLGTIDLFAARDGRDPLRERSAPLPAAIGGLASGEVVTARVHALGDGGDPLTLSFAAPRAPEFARPPRTFVPPPARVEARRPAEPGPDPSAPWVLLAGVVALAASAGAGFFSRSRRAGA